MNNILNTLALSAALIGVAQASEPQPTVTHPEETTSSSSGSLHYQNPQTTSPIMRSGEHTWTGFYVGLFLGGGYGDNQITTTGQVAANVNNVNGGARPASVTLGRQGILGGAGVGYNRQFGKFVFGAETDLGGSSVNGQRTVVTTALTGGASLNNTFSSSLKYLGTARGRAGVAFGRTLVYGTGGLAYGSSENYANFYGASPANVLQFTGSANNLKTGYVAGGGIESAFSKKLSVKAEYLHYDLGSDLLNVAVITGSGGGGTGYNTSFENKGNLVRAGINYRF